MKTSLCPFSISSNLAIQKAYSQSKIIVFLPPSSLPTSLKALSPFSPEVSMNHGCNEAIFCLETLPRAVFSSPSHTHTYTQNHNVHGSENGFLLSVEEIYNAFTSILWVVSSWLSLHLMKENLL